MSIEGLFDLDQRSWLDGRGWFVCAPQPLEALCLGEGGTTQSQRIWKFCKAAGVSSWNGMLSIFSTAEYLARLFAEQGPGEQAFPFQDQFMFWITCDEKLSVPAPPPRTAGSPHGTHAGSYRRHSTPCWPPAQVCCR